MSITVTTTTGEVFMADAAVSIVRMMIDSERLRARKRLDTFMRSTARRCRIQTGATIDPSAADVFLLSLEREGFVTIEVAA